MLSHERAWELQKHVKVYLGIVTIDDHHCIHNDDLLNLPEGLYLTGMNLVAPKGRFLNGKDVELACLVAVSTCATVLFDRSPPCLPIGCLPRRGLSACSPSSALTVYNSLAERSISPFLKDSQYNFS